MAWHGRVPQGHQMIHPDSHKITQEHVAKMKQEHLVSHCTVLTSLGLGFSKWRQANNRDWRCVLHPSLPRGCCFEESNAPTVVLKDCEP